MPEFETRGEHAAMAPFPPELLDAAEEAVREAPGGITAAAAALRVREILTAPGEPPPRLLPRGKMLAVLGELERAGKVSRRRGQATVTFHPAQEGQHAEQPE